MMLRPPSVILLLALSGLCLLQEVTSEEVSVSEQSRANSCPLEAQACVCERHNGGHDVWCPSRLNHEIHLHYRPGQLFLICEPGKNLDEAQLLFTLRDTHIRDNGARALDSLTVEHCPLFTDSYVRLFEAMNVTGAKDLIVRGTHSIVKGNLGPSYFSGLGIKKMSLEGLFSPEMLTIDKDVFKGLGDNLESLVLSNIGAGEFPSGILDLVPNLNYLKIISEEGMSEIPATLFKGLNKLQKVSLTIDDLTRFPEGLFDDCVEMTELSLLRTKMGSGGFPQNLLEKNTKLTNFTSNGPGLEHVAEGFFANTNLKSFVWNGVRLSRDSLLSPSSFLKGASSLRTVSIYYLTVGELQLGDDFFEGCSSLRSVLFEKISLKQLPGSLFHDAEELRELKIVNNKYWKNIPEGFFHKTTKLIALDLSRNDLQSPNASAFKFLTHLKKLDLRKNNLTVLDKDTFYYCVKLEELLLSLNKINLSQSINWDPLGKLELLDLSENEIALSTLPSSWTLALSSLKTLNLKGNQIGPTLSAIDLGFTQNSIVVNLTDNVIERISFNTLLHVSPEHRSAPVPVDQQAVLILTGNPLICDCEALEMAKTVLPSQADDAPESGARFKIEVSPDQKCHGPPSLEDRTLQSLELKELSCEFPSAAFGAGVTCPGSCKCKFTPSENLVSVDCSNGNLKQPPSFLPLISSSEEVLLDLRDNQLTSLAGTNIQNFANVTQLLASNNQIKTVSASDLPPKLRKLELDSNRLTHLNTGMISALGGLEDISLGYNKFSCSCDSRALFDFVKTNYLKFDDLGNITLACGSTPDKPLHTYHLSEFCSSASDDFVTYVLPFLILLLFILFFIVIVLYYRETILIYLYSHPRLRKLLFISDYSVKDYDVFVSYSDLDSEYVEGVLVPELENAQNGDSELKYRVNFHKRDFDPGESIVHNIMRAVEKSSRTLIVLSKNFIKSEHCDTEFSAAHSKKRAIVVVYGELPPKKELSKEIAHYVSANTYLTHDDPWFWQKLRYALPHKGRRSRSRQRINSDRMQLIDKPTPKANGNGTVANGGEHNGCSHPMAGKSNATYIVSNPDLSASMNGGPTMFMDSAMPPGQAMRQESYERPPPVEVPMV